MKKTHTISISGMHCRSCELLIEDALSDVPGVIQVNVDHKTGLATIRTDGRRLNLRSVTDKVCQCGYAVSDKKINNNLAWLSKNSQDYIDLFFNIGLVAALLYALNAFGLLNIQLIKANSISGLPIVLLIGMTAGVSTCMALVGGLVLATSAKFNNRYPHASGWHKFQPHLLFNLARIISFFLLGSSLGYIGSLIQLSPIALGVFTIVVALVMLLLGLQLLGMSPLLSSISFTLPKQLAAFPGVNKNKEKPYSAGSALIAGALTFFLPCGFTQAMQAYAITLGNPIAAGLTMAVFAIGTAPGLLSIGMVTSLVRGETAQKLFRFVGVIVIAMALFNLNNGFVLAGFFVPTDSIKVVKIDSAMENGKQVVRMKQLGNGYEPNSFVIKKGVPVKWVITSEAPGSCASSLVLAKYNIRKNLQAGENIIEFTPTENGVIPFSCSMGMYRGSFQVVD